ncbi:MAG: phosphatidate cytidylyltransferase [Clostridia bacterium]|nr:phosphatidate cytidylyltransferase [Clostridia bacterium]
MKIRLISGSVYVALLVGFYLLKIFISDLFFDALIWFFSIMGTFEMTRAMKEKITESEKCAVFFFAGACIPTTALLSEFVSLTVGALSAAICFFVLAVWLLSLLVARHEETTPENLGVAFLSAVYPTVLLTLLCLVNHFTGTKEAAKFAFNSNLAILFVFVISPVADSLAYVFGRLLKGKFPKKMAPVLSPNKTVVGGIGGLFGGIVGAAALYFIYGAVVLGGYERMALWLPVYLGIGLLSAAATAFGDLVESCIKRKAEIKDMGKIMPGHGGVLDRIDGTLFATVVICLAFAVVYAVL